MPFMQLVSDTPNEDDALAAAIRETLALADGAGLRDFIREDRGTARLVPRPVHHAMTLEVGVTVAARTAAGGGEADPGIVDRSRAQWRDLTASHGITGPTDEWELDDEQPDEDERGGASDGVAPAGVASDGVAPDAITSDGPASWDPRGDIECLVDSLSSAAFESRERWGEWLLTVGVALGIYVADQAAKGEARGEDRTVTMGAVEVANLLGVAAEVVEERAAVC